MEKSRNNILEILSISLFSLYFIFNFFDRSISNIFLVLTLLLCLVNYKKVYEAMTANIGLVISILLFSIYVTLIGFYHNSPLRDLDNYYRFLLLIPLLSISINEPRITKLIFASAVVGLAHAIYNNAFHDILNFMHTVSPMRYEGTSSTIITYSNMCATLLLICLYYIFYIGNKSFYLTFSAITFLILFILTGTRGPVIGIILSLSYLLFILSKDSERKVNLKYLFSGVLTLLVLILIIPNPLGDRLKNIKNIDLNKPLEIQHVSLRERVYMFTFAIEEIEDNYILGIGPQNLEIRMKKSLVDKNIKNISTHNHLHNDLLDIVLKFGLISLILLFLIYFFLINKKNAEHRVMLSILMIILLSSQLTQSQFSHHQAITFFISLFYLLQTKTKREVK